MNYPILPARPDIIARINRLRQSRVSRFHKAGHSGPAIRPVDPVAALAAAETFPASSRSLAIAWEGRGL